MRIFHFHPLSAAIILSVLLMGALGAFVIVPIAFIHWTWNSVVAHFSSLPQINGWQAMLLYLALACLIYLCGFVQIEFKTETVD